MFTAAGEPDAAQREFIEAFKRATFGVEEKRLAGVLDKALAERLDSEVTEPGQSAPARTLMQYAQGLLSRLVQLAALFMSAGIVDHETHTRDIRRLGGLGPKMKITFATFAVGMMALSGVPFLFSGFWSKEAILHAAHGWQASHLPFFVGLAAVGLTAFYMTRLVAETFFGPARSPAAEHAQENSVVMTFPLVVLAAGAIGLGFLGTPMWPWLQSALNGAPVEPETFSSGAGLMLLSVALVGAGLGLGGWLYGRALRPSVTERDPLAVATPKLFHALAQRLGFDELYAATFGRALTLTAAFADGLDRHVIGGLVRFVGQFGRFTGFLNRELDEDALNDGFDRVSDGLRGTGRRYSRAQTGDAHGYLRVLAIGFVLVVVVLLIGGAR
jgi:NADH-quinone oxidoreductase subunit L